MALFKCKMCGGTLNVGDGDSIATCEYCGMKQTLPKVGDDKRSNMYERANHLRRNNEFDKASAIYEQILIEDNTDAEAYWSLVLCRYGIEYVEDPATRQHIPTVNRTQFTSVFDDDNYRSALRYSDEHQRQLYEEEAKHINEIQKGILAISNKEEPFDIFICYKETDANGRRTPDSVLAQEMYYQLKQEGFKVFFSRITLEDKLGSAYEPYIFAALNSSKAMIVLGTKPEYFNAVWVKNEWSRYLALIKKGEKKTLIPAYRDMDPYNLPEEFSHLQAQDMSKLGFMQDLIRGIKKIVKASAPKETSTVSVNPTVAPLLKRAFLFLEDGDFESADEYCEKVLDLDPENGNAYLGKLMCELEVKSKEQLKELEEPFDNSNNYQKAIRFGDDELKAMLRDCVEYVKNKAIAERLENTYVHACDLMDSAKTELGYKDAERFFKSITDYKDSKNLAKKCAQKAEETRKDSILADAKSRMGANNIASYEKAIELFVSIAGWKDADECVKTCEKKIETINAINLQMQQTRQLELEEEYKNNKNAKIVVSIMAFVLVAAIIFSLVLPMILRRKNEEYVDTTVSTNATVSTDATVSTNATVSTDATVCVHTGGQATCTQMAICTKCNNPYGELAPDGHDWSGDNCIYCGTEKYSQGILYTLDTTTDTYTVAGIGDCIDSEIIIPSTYNGKAVTSIGDNAFYCCSSLTSIEIPNSVTSIGDKAFYYCYSLTSIEIPNSLTSIGSSAFLVCNSLTYTEYNNGKYLGNSTNPYVVLVDVIDRSVTSFTIPNTTKIIYDSAFSGCDSLTSIEIPNSVTSIGDLAFSSCESLTSIEIPNSVTSIGEGAFSGCSRLTSITFENTSGWTADGTSISSTNLANPSTAATYLKSTYDYCYWKRS